MDWKDGAEETHVNAELIEAKIESTENIFERVLMESEDYKRVKDLPNFMDLFNGSDQIIDEKLNAYQTSMKRNTKDKKKLIADCSRKMRAAEL